MSSAARKRVNRAMRDAAERRLIESLRLQPDIQQWIAELERDGFHEPEIDGAGGIGIIAQGVKVWSGSFRQEVRQSDS